MLEPDYYELLGVVQNASKDEIAATYRRLIKKYHPDFNLNDGEAIKKTKLCNEAYQVLVNPEKRALYDASVEINVRKRQWYAQRQEEEWRQKETKSRKREQRQGEQRKEKESEKVWTPEEWIWQAKEEWQQEEKRRPEEARRQEEERKQEEKSTAFRKWFKDIALPVLIILACSMLCLGFVPVTAAFPDGHGLATLVEFLVGFAFVMIVALGILGIVAIFQYKYLFNDDKRP
jgi:curved DNA-binding protein CbpA